MQMHGKHAADPFLEFLARTRLPWPAAPGLRVRSKRRWDGDIFAAILRVCEAPWEDGERGLSAVEESAVQVVVQMGAPIEGVGSRWRERGHDVECLAEIWRMSSEMHERAIEAKIRLVCSIVSICQGDQLETYLHNPIG